MNIETILMTIDYLEKLKESKRDETLNNLILFWRLQTNQHKTEETYHNSVEDIIRTEINELEVADEIYKNDMDIESFTETLAKINLLNHILAKISSLKK